jgi:ABC-2 type transport system ATP-binding protein
LYAIETSNLTKRYGSITAVDHLNLKVKRGEIFGYLGHNGSGKTTTIMMLCGLVEPTQGSATVAGFDVQREVLEVKKRIGFLPENASYYGNLTARQNLEFFGELAGLTRRERKERSEELLNLVGLEEWKDVKVDRFSKGMQQRLGIAQALVRDPEVLFFDEPTSGLDPQGTRDIRNLILKLGREEGKTIFLSSHLLAEVKQLCDRVGILKRGKLIALGSVRELARELNRDNLIKIELEVDSIDAALRAVRNISGVNEVVNEDGKIIIRAENDIRREVFHAVSCSGLEILSLKLVEPSLEEVFLKAYGVE